MEFSRVRQSRGIRRSWGRCERSAAEGGIEKELKEKEAEVEKFKEKRFAELVGGGRSAKQIEALLLATLETFRGTREQFRDAPRSIR